MLLSDNALEAEAADAALEEMQFFDQMDALSLFDEIDEEEEELARDRADAEWYDEVDEEDLGEYEDDPEDWDDEEPPDRTIGQGKPRR
jgi:hypothetical protein